MHDRPSTRRTRREFLQTSVAVPATLALAASAWRLIDLAPLVAVAQGQILPPTPACPDPDDVTPAQTEGPFYKPRSPQRTSLLEPGVTGTKIVVAGYVLTRTCRPVPRALVDFWHADDRGEYDHAGFRLRGHQFTDEAGRYHLETIVPGLYPGRTRHFHVKVQAANRPVLTTQLYFPGEPRNQTDRIFHPRLLLDVREAAGGRVATFNFVLDIR
ncbi:MAG: intradiol ring-cleavage dioxygenase [Armatimonadota bacterium]|nr:intradiol ring-cleavage dioxygenase [Armatimonadota bacterium]MDR7518431.1 intradiol ring-cleavage dioxygenase [Armatimonadota bacterium]MDR7550172.1 intradiol ring-cleavage dioxygenase [Armatimonadota bacterium]